MTIKITRIIKTGFIEEEVKSEELVTPEAYACKRCSYTWKPRSKSPKFCPKCKSKYWNFNKTYLNCVYCRYGWKQKTSNLPKECPRCGSESWNAPELRELDDSIAWLEKEIKRQEAVKSSLTSPSSLVNVLGVVSLTFEAKKRAKKASVKRTHSKVKKLGEVSEPSESLTSPSSPSSLVGSLTSTLKPEKLHAQSKSNHPCNKDQRGRRTKRTRADWD